MSSLQDRAERGQRERGTFPACRSDGPRPEGRLRLAAVCPAGPNQITCSLQQFDGCVPGLVSRGLRLKRWSGVNTPLERQPVEDQAGPRRMHGPGHNLSRMPVVSVHNTIGEAGVLDSVSRLRLDIDRRLRNPLGLGGSGHHLGFDESILNCAAGDNEPRSHASLVLPYCLGHARQLQRLGVAVAISRRTKNNDGVKTRKGCVGVWRDLPRNGSPRQYCRHRSGDRQGEPRLPIQAFTPGFFAGRRSAADLLAADRLNLGDCQRETPPASNVPEAVDAIEGAGSLSFRAGDPKAVQVAARRKPRNQWPQRSLAQAG